MKWQAWKYSGQRDKKLTPRRMAGTSVYLSMTKQSVENKAAEMKRVICGIMSEAGLFPAIHFLWIFQRNYEGNVCIRDRYIFLGKLQSRRISQT